MLKPGSYRLIMELKGEKQSKMEKEKSGMKSEKERRQKMKEGGGKKREKSTRKQNI
jgi:hypothetical protein